MQVLDRNNGTQSFLCKACPFCGGIEKEHLSEVLPLVKCNKCGATAARSIWNIRYSEKLLSQAFYLLELQASEHVKLEEFLSLCREYWSLPNDRSNGS